MEKKKNSFLLVLTCAMAMLMMASRCSDDEENSPANAPKESSESATPPTSLDEDTLKSNPESGVEKDPLGETLGGDDDATAPLEDIPPPGGDDSQMLDDPSFEPEPVPDEASDL